MHRGLSRKHKYDHSITGEIRIGFAVWLGSMISPDSTFFATAQSSTLWAGSVNGGCSGLKKYMSDFPSSLTVSSLTLKSVIPLALKNLAAILVPEKNERNIP